MRITAMAALVAAALTLSTPCQAQVLKGKAAERLFVVAFSDVLAQNAAYQLPNAALGVKLGSRDLGIAPFVSVHSLGLGAYAGEERGLFVGAGWKMVGGDQASDSQGAEQWSVIVGSFSTGGRRDGPASAWHAGSFFDVGALGEAERSRIPRLYASRDLVSFARIRGEAFLHAGPYVSTTGFGGSLSFGPERSLVPVRIGAGIGLEWRVWEPEVETIVFLGFGL